MTDLAVNAAGVLAAWLLTYLLHSTVLLLAAGLVARWLARAPAQRDALGKTALLVPLCTTCIAMAGGPSGLQPLPGTGAELVQEGALRTALVVRGPVEWTDEGDLFALATAERLRREGGAQWPWQGMLLLAWACGSLVALLRLVRAWASIRGVRATLAACSPRVLRLGSELAPDGAPRLRLRSSEVFDTPCVLPGGVLVLSARAQDELDEDELRAVIAHEAAHVARRDAEWFALLHVLASLLWLQPLNRVAIRVLRDNAELVCDDWAVARTDGARHLARSIATVAGWGPSTVPLGSMPMVRPGGGPSSRVRRLLHGSARRPMPWWTVAFLPAVLALPGLLLPAVAVKGERHRVVFFEENTVVDVHVDHGPSASTGAGTMRRTRVLVRRLEMD